MTLAWLSSDSNVTIWLHNDSGAQLQNVSLILPDLPYPTIPVNISPADTQDFVTKTRTSLPIRLTFDAGGRHYDLPVKLRLGPLACLGCSVISISIGRNMDVSVKTKIVSC